MPGFTDVCKRLKQGLTPYTPRITVSTLITATTTFIDLTMPYLFMKAVDILNENDKEEDSNASLTTFILLGFATAWTSKKILSSFRDIVLAPTGAKLGQKLTIDVMEHFYNLPLEYRVSNTDSPVVDHFTAAHERIAKAVSSDLFGKATPAIAEISAISGLMLYRYRDIGLILAGTTIINLIAIIFGLRPIGKSQEKFVNFQLESYAILIENLDQCENTLYNGNIDYELSKLDSLLLNLSNSDHGRIVSSSLVKLLCTIIMGMGYLGSTVYLLSEKHREVDDFIWVTFYTLQLVTSLDLLSQSTNPIYCAYNDFKRILEYIALEQEDNINQGGDLELNLSNSSKKDIIFRNVSFHYEDGKPVLNDVSFNIPEGKLTVIAGLSGGGKSTILKLIFGFLKMKSGFVSIAGQDLNTLDVNSLRKEISVVPQHVVLFSGTLFDNVRYGRRDANEEEIAEAIRIAGLQDFIDQHDDGMYASVGEGGQKLSGGQKRRVAIARAYLRDTNYLLLDEPTSGLDLQTEVAVLDNLNRLIAQQHTTTVLVTHKLASIAHLSGVAKVIMFRNGKIYEMGTPAELMRSQGLFAQEINYIQHCSKISFFKPSRPTSPRSPTINRQRRKHPAAESRASIWELAISSPPLSPPPLLLSDRRGSVQSVQPSDPELQTPLL